MRYQGRLTVVTLMFALAIGQAANAQDRSPRIVNGLQTSDYPTTGALLNGGSADSAQTWCSGTLIGCNTFLTAGHCVVDNPTPSRYFVFLQHAGIFNVTSIEIHPTYNFPVGDVAVLKLGTAVTGIRPTRINTVQDPPFDTPGTIAGFGRSGGAANDYGLKRYGTVSTGSCASAGESNTTSVCWTFNLPLGAEGTNSNTCNGDSGGPLFLTLGGQTVVAGITSGGVVDSCLTGDVSFDADVYHYRAFIQAEGGTDIDSTSCGNTQQVGDSSTATGSFSGSVSSGTPQATHSFAVAPGIDELRVTMNAVDDGSDFDLYVKRGSAPTPTNYDCARTGSNQFGACSFANPVADTWYVMVRRYSGGGVYQITTTSFAAGCTDPANEGHACDDRNPCTSGDLCSAGVCAGSVVADGAECGTGTLCTGPATCDAGACKTNAIPAMSCKHTIDSGRAAITVKDSSSSSGDKVQWKWKGESTSDFGNPTFQTDYALCVYDETGGVTRLVVDQTVPRGAGWIPKTYGYQFTDSLALNDGVRSIKLRRGGDGKASITILARGANVSLPTLPLDQDSQVLVQLVTSQNHCWEARYSGNTENSSTMFRAKSD